MPTISQESELENMKAKLNALVQERDSALELLVTAENETMKAKADLKQAQYCSEFSIRQQMENMKQDYSDAITMIDSKCRDTIKELHITRESNAILMKTVEDLNVKIATKDSELKELLGKLEVLTKERDELQSALEHCHHRIDEAKNMEKQARDKVSEAIVMVQDALQKESAMAGEKSKLEKAMECLIDEASVKVGKEVELVKQKLNSKIESLTEQLREEMQEKNRLLMECKNMKADHDLKVQTLTLKNEALTKQLKDMEQREQSDNAQFVSERDLLRRQVLTLQTAVEHIPEIMRQQQEAFKCQRCPELLKCVNRYRDLTIKYKRTVDKMGAVFENAMNEERREWRIHYQLFGFKK